MAEATGTFEVAGWDEDAYDEPADGGKLASAAITQKWAGDFAGDAAIRMLSAYRPDGTARWVGVQRMTGTLGGREGTFSVVATGEFDGSVARGDLRVLDGTGTGGFAGITGEGSFEAPMGPSGTYSLTYSLA